MAICWCAHCIEDRRIEEAERRAIVETIIANGKRHFEEQQKKEEEMNLTEKVDSLQKQMSKMYSTLAEQINKVQEGTLTDLDHLNDSIDARFEDLANEISSIDSAFESVLESIDGQFDELEDAVIDMAKHFEDPLPAEEEEIADPCVGCEEDCEWAEPAENCGVDCEETCEENMSVILSRKELGKLAHLIGNTLKTNKDYLVDIDEDSWDSMVEDVSLEEACRILNNKRSSKIG